MLHRVRRHTKPTSAPNASFPAALREAHDKPFQEEHPMRKITKRSAAIIGATVIAIGGGAAWAAWSLGGSAAATASAGSSTPLTVGTPSINGQLLPGNPADVAFAVTNPNSFNVQVNGLSFTNIASKNTIACPSSNFVSYLPAFTPFNLTPGQGVDLNFDNAIGLKTNPDNGCQGVGVDFTVSLTAVSTD
jgi:hypothetical protein